MKAALIVIDCQQRFYRGETAGSLDRAAGVINAAAGFFRERGLPVIWIRHRDPADRLVEGEEGFGYIDSLDRHAGETEIVKEYGNSFNGTPLKAILDRGGTDTVIVTGYCAEYCVLSTARGAKDLDLAAILLRGALASDHPENIPFVERVNDLISLGALEKALEPAC